MEALFLSIQKCVADFMPELRIVDEDYGQLNAEEDTYPVAFPCVLIQIEEIDWSDLGGGKQKGNATIRVKLAVDCYDDTHYSSGTAQKVRERMQLYRKLHEKLNNFKGGILSETGQAAGHIDNMFSPLRRAKSVFYSLPGGVKIYESIYTCTVFDL